MEEWIWVEHTFRLSAKKTLIVESKRETASRRWSGLKQTLNTSSDIWSVLTGIRINLREVREWWRRRVNGRNLVWQPTFCLSLLLSLPMIDEPAQTPKIWPYDRHYNWPHPFCRGRGPAPTLLRCERRLPPRETGMEVQTTESDQTER